MDADELPDGRESLGEAEREQKPRGVRLKLGIAYDGAGFSGWAPQAERRTVAGVLTDALRKVLRLPETPRLTVAGRTDAGVHARGQVAHLDLPEDAWLALSIKRGRTEPPPDPDAAAARAMLRRMASALPDDVRLRSVELAPPGFDARFSALWRRYSYRVCDDFGRTDPLRRQDTLWYHRPLDIDAMNTAAAGLTGEHDFAAFCKKREGATTVRGLRWLDWRRDEDGIAVARVVADAFCHNMVRALVGSLLPVGAGDKPAEWPAAVLAAGVRDPGVRVAPPHPLCLEEVRYPDPDQLAARAEQTRRIRVLLQPRGDDPPEPPDARPMARAGILSGARSPRGTPPTPC